MDTGHNADVVIESGSFFEEGTGGGEVLEPGLEDGDAENSIGEVECAGAALGAVEGESLTEVSLGFGELVELEMEIADVAAGVRDEDGVIHQAHQNKRLRIVVESLGETVEVALDLSEAGEGAREEEDIARSPGERDGANHVVVRDLEPVCSAGFEAEPKKVLGVFRELRMLIHDARP